MGDVNVKKTAEILGVGLTEKQEAAAEGIDVIIRNSIGEGYSRVVELAFLTQAIRKEMVPIMVWDPRVVARSNRVAKVIAANAVKMTENTELAGRFQVCGFNKDHIVYSRNGKFKPEPSNNPLNMDFIDTLLPSSPGTKDIYKDTLKEVDAKLLRALLVPRYLIAIDPATDAVVTVPARPANDPLEVKVVKERLADFNIDEPFKE